VDGTLLSLLFESSFAKECLSLDSLSKFSHLDHILIYNNTRCGSVETLFISFMNDLVIQTSTCFLPISPLLQSEYQDSLTTILALTPELSTMLNDFISSYFLSSSFDSEPSAVFDSYNLTLFSEIVETVEDVLLFGLFVWLVVYFFTVSLSLR